MIRIIVEYNKPRAGKKKKRWSVKYKKSINCSNPKGFSQKAYCKRKARGGDYKNEGKEPAKGTGKKPKGSSRRLYTDENPKDTVPVKFKTATQTRTQTRTQTPTSTRTRTETPTQTRTPTQTDRDCV